MWWHLGYDTLVTSEWDTPDMFENGLMPELLLAGKYGHKLHFWDLHRRKHLQEIDFGAQHQLIFELRPAHDPTKAYGFVNCVLSLSPWLTLVGLGMYHGVNPAMGWLFAAALGLHRGRRVVVMQSLVPIAIGHLLSIAATVEIALVLGIIIDRRRLLMVAGGGLILWALYHLAYGSRHPARVGMQAGLAGLLVWSFLMASAHGAGLMLVPAVFPLCFSGDETSGVTVAGVTITPLAVACVHTAVMVIVSGIIAILVYDWIGLGFLRRGWINFDWLWTAALGVTGMIVLALTRS